MKTITDGVQLNTANDHKTRQDFVSYLVDAFGYNANVADAMVVQWQKHGFVVSRCTPWPNN
jgi:hypothetical protein